MIQGWTVSNWMGQLSQSGTLVIIIMQNPNRQFGQGDCPGEIEGVYAWGKVAMATKQVLLGHPGWHLDGR